MNINIPFLTISALALAFGMLTQQLIETLLNTSLTLLPFNIRTVS